MQSAPPSLGLLATFRQAAPALARQRGEAPTASDYCHADVNAYWHAGTDVSASQASVPLRPDPVHAWPTGACAQQTRPRDASARALHVLTSSAVRDVTTCARQRRSAGPARARARSATSRGGLSRARGGRRPRCSIDSHRLGTRPA